METKETEAVSLSTLEPVRHGRFLRPTWHGSDGVRNLLIVSAPLIIGNVANSINLLVDRILLGIYSPSAFAAALQSGTVHWTLMGLATGLVTYAGTFIAQYTGARRPDRVGPALWQGVYLALICGGLAALLAIPAPAFFRWIGHEGVLPQLEAQYFQVFALGSVAFLLKECFACFYIGRGKTGVVMAVNAFTCVANILLNYRLIFSPPYPLPGGMRGSALASVIATLLGAAAFAVLIFSREHDSIFHVLRGWRPDFTLLARLIRFGLPSGAQWFIDMVAFSVFLLAIGKFGFEAQFASNVAMSANLLLFIPAIGIAQGATVLAGQFAGARRHERTERLASASLLVCGVYMGFTCVLYAGIPQVFANFFRSNIGDAEWSSLLHLSRILLLVVAFYSVFDAINLAVSGLLKGSGDTRFVMLLAMIFSQGLLTGPCIVLVLLRDRFEPRTGLLWSWAFCSAYIMFLATAFILRYRNGKWKTLRVIEERGGETRQAPEALPLPVSVLEGEASSEALAHARAVESRL